MVVARMLGNGGHQREAESLGSTSAAIVGGSDAESQRPMASKGDPAARPRRRGRDLVPWSECRSAQTLSWRWFVPRSRVGFVGFNAVAVLFAAIVFAFGVSAAAWFGAFASFQILLAVATRRMPFWGRLGRLSKADPLVASHVLDARSRPGAVGGTAIAVGVGMGLILLGLAGVVR